MSLDVICESVGKEVEEDMNGDAYLATKINEGFFIAAIADGITTSGKKGEVATASKAAIQLLERNARDLAVTNDSAIDPAGYSVAFNDAIRLTALQYQAADIKGETTLTAIAIQGNRLEIAQIGDSIAYLIRGNKIYRLTDSQDNLSLLEQHFKKKPNELTLDELLSLISFPMSGTKNILTSCLCSVGGKIYNKILKVSNALGSDKTYVPAEEEEDFAVVKRYCKDKDYSNNVLKLLTLDEIRELAIALIRLAYRRWNTQEIMMDENWRDMYSALSGEECVIDGFSSSARKEMVKQDCKGEYIRLSNGDSVVLVSDGVITNVIHNYLGQYVNLGIREDWNCIKNIYAIGTVILKGMLRQDAESAAKKVTSAPIKKDDATIVVIKYYKNEFARKAYRLVEGIKTGFEMYMRSISKFG